MGVTVAVVGVAVAVMGVAVAVVGVANNIMVRFFNSSYISMCLNYLYSKGSQSEAFRIIEGLPYLYQMYQNSFFFFTN